MPRFFVPSANFDGDTVRITGDDARHIARALRMAVGETVTVAAPVGEQQFKIIAVENED